MTREEEIQKYADELAQQYFPDESNIWARRNIEAEFVSEACVRMAKHIEQELIEKACQWLKENIDKDLVIYKNQSWIKRDVFIDKLKKAMEE